MRRSLPRNRPQVAAAVLFWVLSASPGTAQELLELAWAWSVPKPSDIRAFVVDTDDDGVDEILLTNRSSVQSLIVSDGGFVQRWTTLPLEDSVRAMALSAGIGSDPPEILVATGPEIRFLDTRSGETLRSVQSAVGEVYQIAIADLTSDGSLEIVSCGYFGLAVQDSTTGETVASAPTGDCDQLLIGQLDGDTPSELVVAGDDGVLVLDGETLEVEWAAPEPGSQLAQIGQLDGEGPLEIVTYAYDYPIRAWKGTSGEKLWERTDHSVLSWTPFDLAGDSAEELVVGSWDSWPSSLSILDGRTGKTLDTLDVERPYWMVVGHLDSDASPELLWASGILSSDGDFLRITDLETGNLEAESLGFEGYFFDLHAQRSLDTGLVELLIAGRTYNYVENGNVLSLNAADGSVSGLVDLPPVPHGPRSAGPLLGLDLDDSAPLELLSEFNDLSSMTVECFDRIDAALRWRMFVPDGSESGHLAVVEIDGDVRPEILVPIEYHQPEYDLRLFAIEGENGWLKWGSPSLGDASSGYQAMVDYAVGDVDGDGSDEIVFTSGRYATENFGILAAADGSVQLPLVPELGYSQLELAQLDGDAALEVVASDLDGGLLILDPTTGGVESSLGALGSRIDVMVTGDFTHDGVADFATASYRNLAITDGVTGEIVWSAPYLGDGSGDLADLLALDGDGDGKPELAVATSWGIALFSMPSDPIFADGFESGDASAWSDVQP